MTAPATERPRTADALRAELRERFEEMHELNRNSGGDYDGWALACINDHRPDLSPFAKALLREDFTTAVDRLAEVRDDAFDPTQWDEDRDVLEARYDERAEAVITTLMGGC